MIENGMLRGDYNGTPHRNRPDRERQDEIDAEMTETSGLEELAKAKGSFMTTQTPTDQQLIEAIAKWEGWIWVALIGFPNYLKDLNAIQSTVMKLDKDKWKQFSEHLLDVCEEELGDVPENLAVFLLVNATSRQRAIALYETIKDLVVVEQKKGEQ